MWQNILHYIYVILTSFVFCSFTLFAMHARKYIIGPYNVLCMYDFLLFAFVLYCTCLIRSEIKK